MQHAIPPMISLNPNPSSVARLGGGRAVADEGRNQHVLQDRNDHEEADGVPEGQLLVDVRQEVEVGWCEAVPDEVERDGQRS